MSSELLVNQAGTIRNVQFLGFTNTSAWGELIDNSNDAGAKEVIIGLFKWTDEDGNPHYGYYIADDASGMTKQKLRESCILNNPQNSNGRQLSFGDKSGRFGIGGSAALNVISKTSGSIQKITRSKESRDLFAIKVNYNTDESLPTAHEASRRQEELWSRFAIHSYGTGTVIIGEVDEATYAEIQHLMTDKTIHGLPWYIADTFHHKIDAGLTIGIRAIDDTTAAPTVVVPSFNSSGSLDDARVIRESHPILILKNKTTGELRFGERDGGDDDECARSLPLNTKAQKNTKWNLLRLDSYDNLGVVQINLAFSQEWDKIHEDQLLGQFEIGKLAEFREKTIVRRYTRSGRCVISFPTPKRKQGDKAAYPYYENVIQEIVMQATEVSDKIFGTQVNKSLLDEKKIHTELKKLIDHLSNVFSDRLYKKNFPEVERKKKSRLSDDATSVASDDTESVFDDDVVSLSSSMSVRSYARRTSASSLLPAVAAVAGGGDDTVKQTKKTAISSTVPPPQEELQQNEVAVTSPVSIVEQPPVISTVSTHTAVKITRATGLSYLRRLYEEQGDIQISELCNTLIRKNQNPEFNTQVDLFLMFMQPADKYRMLTYILNTGSPDDFMKGGGKLYRAYHQYYSE